MGVERLDFLRRWRRRRAARLAAEGRLLLKRGEPDEAQRRFRSALSLDGESAAALLGCAEIALDREDVGSYLDLTNRLVRLRRAMRPPERIAVCHRLADVLLRHCSDAAAAVEALTRIELDYPGSADAARAKRRIERILEIDQRQREREI